VIILVEDNITKGSAHTTDVTAPNTPLKYVKDSSYISATCTSKCTHEWFVDSGAIERMTDQRSFFRSFIPMLHDRP
jgi:hypothetical protein